MHKLDCITLQSFTNACNYNPPTERKGQYAMNLLHTLRPELYDKVMDNDAGDHRIDPFYVDNNLPAFFAFLATVWDADGS